MNRTQVVLLIAVLSLGSFFIYSKKAKFEKEDREHQAARYFPNLKTEEVGSLTLWSKEPAFEYKVTRNADRWWLDGHMVAIESSEQLVYSLVELKQVKMIAENPSQENLKEYGFDEPSFKVSVFGLEGDDLGTVVLGDRTPDINHFYAQMAKGGPIHTLEAYMLTLLDEKPEDLREKSIFPVEVAAVDNFLLESAAGVKAQFEKTRDKDDTSKGTFRLKAEDKEVDETKVDAFMNDLKDLKIARFLGDDEKTEIGTWVVRYESQEDWSKFATVSELCQPVAVNPELRYGRRYLVKFGESEPAQGTIERFVVKLALDSPLLNPDLSQFQDLRVIRLTVDDVTDLSAEYEGKSLLVQRLTPGLWKFIKPGLEAGPATSQHVNDVLWALRDLHFLEKTAAGPESDKVDWSMKLTLEDDSYELRFGTLENGKPYVETKGQRYLLKDESTSALTEALQKILSK